MTPLVPTSGPISLVDITTAPVTQSTWVSDAPFDRLAQARDFAEVTGGVVEFSTHSAALDLYATTTGSPNRVDAYSQRSPI